MGALSTFAVNGLQDLTLRGDAFASPTDVYLGWFTTPPGPSGGIEVTGGGYGREAVTFTAASEGTIEQDAAVTYTVFHAGADQMVSGWGIFDAATDGNLLAYGRTPSHVIRAGQPFEVPAGDIVVSSNDAHHSDYLANAWLDHLLGGTAYTPPASIHLGLYDVTPTATTDGSQVAGREAVTFDPAGGQQSVIASASEWAPLDPSNPHTLTGWAISDAATDGNVLVFADWPTPIAIPALDTLSLAAGWLTLRAQ
jgi:hypothetical protein